MHKILELLGEVVMLAIIVGAMIFALFGMNDEFVESGKRYAKEARLEAKYEP